MLTIRPAQPQDASAISAVNRTSILGMCSTSYTQHEIEVWTGLLTPDKYENPLREQIMFVAERDGQIVGYSQLDAVHALVLAVYVSPNSTGTGIGKALLERLETAARQLRIERLLLDATLNAEPFYKHLGYQRLYLNEYRVTPEIALACVRMEKWLR